MKTKVIVILMSAVIFASCEDAHKKLQDNLGQYNTSSDYLNKLYESIKDVANNPNGVKVSAQNLINFVDPYLTYYEKDIPASIDGVNSLDGAMTYYMSVSKQIALIASDFADKAASLTPEEAEVQFYSKLDPLVEAETKTVERWAEIQEEYAKKHGIRLINLNK